MRGGNAIAIDDKLSALILAELIRRVVKIEFLTLHQIPRRRRSRFAYCGFGAGLRIVANLVERGQTINVDPAGGIAITD
ncbi:hypothetical protein D3C76_1719520 [compost metagenome]